MMGLFEVDPGTGWHLYDGANNVAYLKSDGTTATVNLPDLTSAGNKAAFPKAGSPNAAPAVYAIVSSTIAATTATGQGSLAGSSDAPLGHTHPAPTMSGDPANIVRRPWFRQ